MNDLRTMHFDRDYSWMGVKTVRLVPMFATGAMSVHKDSMVWCYDTEDRQQSFHVPSRLLADL